MPTVNYRSFSRLRGQRTMLLSALCTLQTILLLTVSSLLAADVSGSKLSDPFQVTSVAPSPKLEVRIIEKDPLQGLFCRGSWGVALPGAYFRLVSCFDCFAFIYNIKSMGQKFLDRRNLTQLNAYCEATGDSECLNRVNKCCGDAEKCCMKQNRSSAAYQRDADELCPITWDMLSCIPLTKRNTVAKVLCPAFVWQDLSSVYGSKNCLDDASWETRTENNQTWEFTEYRPCIVAWMNKMKVLTIIRLTGNCISLFCLFASLCLFLGIKSLRGEKRIQMHINLFAALFMQLLFETFIHAVDLQQYSVIDGGNIKSIYEFKFCKFIGIANRFFNSATYTWYVCEAVFLYLLLHRTFDSMKSLRFFYLAGWGIPFVINGIYCAIRFNVEESKSSAGRCWLNDLDHLEWVHRGPILIELLMNTGYLIYILHTVCTLQNLSGDGSNYRKSVRAALLLAPLFGLNFVLVMIHRENYGYNIFQCIVAGSQGALVAIIFCFSNEEVKSAIRTTINNRWFKISRTKRSSSARSACTFYTTVPSRPSRGHSTSSAMFNSNNARNDSIPLSNCSRYCQHKASTVSAPVMGQDKNMDL